MDTVSVWILSLKMEYNFEWQDSGTQWYQYCLIFWGLELRGLNFDKISVLAMNHDYDVIYIDFNTDRQMQKIRRTGRNFSQIDKIDIKSLSTYQTWPGHIFIFW